MEPAIFYFSPSNLERIAKSILTSIGLLTMILTSPIGFGQTPNFAWETGEKQLTPIDANGFTLYGVRGQYGEMDIFGPDIYPGGRFSMAFGAYDSLLYIFGGSGFDKLTNTTDVLNDFWVFDTKSLQWAWIGGSDTIRAKGVYGAMGTGDPSNIPGAREGSWGSTDSQGAFWVFGGNGVNGGGTCCSHLSDLWKYDPITKEWTWVSGSELYDQTGSLGTKGVPDPTNEPGSRYVHAGWVDKEDNIWIFGGAYYNDRLNDLWKYDVITNEWTWISGSDNTNQSGVYGSKGVGDAANTPGARNLSANWVDTDGNLWLFGGEGYDKDGSYGFLNDLWKFDVTQSVWIWISGDSQSNSQGFLGEKGVSDPDNVPSSRVVSTNWIDEFGNLWLFGGYGTGTRNDLWKFDIDKSEWTWVKGSSGANGDPNYGTQGIPQPDQIPGARSSPATFRTSDNKFWLFGGNIRDINGKQGESNDVWRIHWVNNMPYYTKGEDISLTEDAGTQTITAWATNINDGDEYFVQDLTFVVTSLSDSSLFDLYPAIDSDGQLTFSPKPNGSGLSDVTILLKDNGGTGLGGIDTTPEEAFKIEIIPVNDAPIFVGGPDINIEEDAGRQVLSWAAQVDDGDDEFEQNLQFELINNSNPSLFSEPPQVAPDGTLTFQSAENAFGESIIEIRLKDDGGIENGGVDTSLGHSFTISVNPVNDPPIVATPIPDQQIILHIEFTIDANTFVDVEDDILKYEATLADDSPLPTWISFDPLTRTFIGTPTEEDMDVIVKVTATDNEGLSVSDEFSMDILITNINLPLSSAPFKVYPNPSSGFVTLRSPSNFQGDVLVRVQDVNGRMIYENNSFKKAEELQPIDLSGEIPGVYLIHIITREEKSVLKILIF